MGPLSFLFADDDDDGGGNGGGRRREEEPLRLALPRSSALRSLVATLASALSLLDRPLALARAMTIPVLPGDGAFEEEEEDDSSSDDDEEEDYGEQRDEGERRQQRPRRRRDWLPIALLLGPLAAALRLCPYSASEEPGKFGASLAVGAFAGALASAVCLVHRSGIGVGVGGGRELGQQQDSLLSSSSWSSPPPPSSSALLLPLPLEHASRKLRKLSVTAVRVFSLLAAALWIDLLASELVGVATLAGAVSGAPPALVGGTLLAWGNSAGDLASNVAVAKKGYSNMALTACYASPLANLLLGLGVGIAAAAARGSPVRLPSSRSGGSMLGGVGGEIAAAAGWIGVMVSAVLAMALLNKRRLPPASSWVLLAVYLCYVAGGLAAAASGGGGGAA